MFAGRLDRSAVGAAGGLSARVDGMCGGQIIAHDVVRWSPVVGFAWPVALPAVLEPFKKFLLPTSRLAVPDTAINKNRERPRPTTLLRREQ